MAFTSNPSTRAAGKTAGTPLESGSLAKGPPREISLPVAGPVASARLDYMAEQLEAVEPTGCLLGTVQCDSEYETVGILFSRLSWRIRLPSVNSRGLAGAARSGTAGVRHSCTACSQCSHRCPCMSTRERPQEGPAHKQVQQPQPVFRPPLSQARTCRLSLE